MKIKSPKEVFDQYAEIYQDRFMDLSLYHNDLDLFCQGIENKNASILDVACGPGNISQYILTKRPDLKLIGIDLAPRMLELAKINNPRATFQLWDCRNIKQLKTKFDAIICSFGLPYLNKTEALQFIQDAAACLSENGVLYLSTMEDDYNKSGPKTASDGKSATLQYYHEADYLSEALSLSGFKQIDLNRISYLGRDAETITDLILISKK